jgi:hypothetical protein
MELPSLNHWYSSGEVPEAETTNSTDDPRHLLAESGWFTILASSKTVRLAGLEVVLPAALVTTH